MVCSAASMSTERPAARAALVVTGPMLAMRQWASAAVSPPRRATRFRTVDALAKVTISIWPAAKSCATSGSSALACTVR